MHKVYIVNDCLGVGDMYRQLGWEIVEYMEDADHVTFTGGEDINPALYSQMVHPRTYYNNRRDTLELANFKVAKDLNKPMVGICRGAQLLNVLAGGSLYQHVDNHTVHHDVYDLVSEKTYRVNSVHHQMMVPAEHADIVAVAQGQSTVREYMPDKEDRGGPILLGSGGVDEGDHHDPEVVWYPDTKWLCFQAHPEFSHRKTTEYFVELLQRYNLGA